MKGWICPLCNAGLSPLVDLCSCMTRKTQKIEPVESDQLDEEKDATIPIHVLVDLLKEHPDRGVLTAGNRGQLLDAFNIDQSQRIDHAWRQAIANCEGNEQVTVAQLLSFIDGFLDNWEARKLQQRLEYGLGNFAGDITAIEDDRKWFASWLHEAKNLLDKK